MKRIYLLTAVMMLLSVAAASAQNYDDTMDEEVVVIENDYEEDEIAVAVSEKASFPGGLQMLYSWLGANIKYPAISRENGSQGTTVLRFVVHKDGRIDGVSIIKSSGDSFLDNEAIRVVKCMPKWTPAKLNGRSVATWYMLPLKFSLGDDKPTNNESDVK